MPDLRKIVKGVAAFILCIGMYACAVSPATQAPQNAGSRTPTNIHATLIPSPVATSTVRPTSTLRPSSTIQPSDTPTIIPPASTFPFDPEGTMTLRAVEQRETQIAGFATTCPDFEPGDTSLSPHGNWLVISCGHIHNQTLEIDSKEGRQWVLQFKDYLAEESIVDGETPMGGLYPAQWTSDEGYLYFASYIDMYADGPCAYGIGYPGLYRIDLNTGAVSVTLPPKKLTNGYFITFSPGGRRVAYSNGYLAILDLITGENIIIKTGDVAVGGLTWSKDGTELAFATCKYNEDDIAAGKSSVKIYALDTGESRTILEIPGSMLNIESWDRNGPLIISIIDLDTGAGAPNYYFDWPSGRFITPAPTPAQ